MLRIAAVLIGHFLTVEIKEVSPVAGFGRGYLHDKALIFILSFLLKKKIIKGSFYIFLQN
ncbi:hypothetical protein DTX80_04655 [Bacilli bacterium]|nr:hypothetical protein WH51_16240 [Bacilli bacterium VT-13-104]PZD87318.1 hypothetical protein DEJ64_05955 [Bacilli bacterium]PZD88792.1 hypothetical protein DEJ60_06050 [Bacilli bacterium]PZD91646.1 hypothetical protein DEJ66_06470 [Bacilli bacterium]RCO06728.1 hypothetical protein DTX80_04655 [Bacilli bacterium]